MNSIRSRAQFFTVSFKCDELLFREDQNLAEVYHLGGKLDCELVQHADLLEEFGKCVAELRWILADDGLLARMEIPKCPDIVLVTFDEVLTRLLL
jgi:hypothetical protein